MLSGRACMTSHAYSVYTMSWPLLLFVLAVIPFLSIVFLRRRPSKFTVGLFHPYADAGGGGERVLWHAISAMIDKWPTVQYTILTGERDKTSEQILDKVSSRFGISIREDNVKFVFLRLRFLIEASTWPRFTLAGQMFGSIILGLEALVYCRPHVLFDTMGYAFTYPLYKWLTGCKIVSYVHYPIVSTDMLRVVASGRASFNNQSKIVRSKFLTTVKIIYYRLVAMMYGFVGRRSNIVMVNSSWTYGHITDIWEHANTSIVYPPCDCKSFLGVASNRPKQEFRIASVGQFRPEKDHKKQIDTIKATLRKWQGSGVVKLVMIGSCRDEGDHRRVAALKEYCTQLDVLDNVEFLVNVSFGRLQEELGRSLIAIHTMWNEHFGISLVECMASGCIMIGHRSGGPQMDIVTEFKGSRAGFLATTADEFSDCIIEVLNMSSEERKAIVASAKESISKRFSVETFHDKLITQMETVMN